MLELKLALGRYDNPEEQTQDDYIVDLLKNNLAIFGTSMSGKTTLLKTLILRLHQMAGLTDKEEIYILDFGNSLKAYRELPYVTGYFNASLEENVRRIFKILAEKLAENIRTLDGGMYAEAQDDMRPNHITFVLDGFSSFWAEDRYAQYHDDLKKLAREGLSKGITTVLTAAETGGFASMISSFGRIIAFDLPKDRYGELYTGKVEKPMILPGRGVANRDTHIYEFQAYLPWDTSDENMDEKRMIQMVDRWIAAYGLNYDRALLWRECDKDTYIRNVLADPDNTERQRKNVEIHKAYLNRKLKSLPETLTADNWESYCQTPYQNETGDFVAGLDYYTLDPVPGIEPAILNLREAQTIAIYGKKKFGKSNLLKLLLEAANRLPDTHFCFWDDLRQSLTKPVGLRETIEGLKSKEFCHSREDFLNCLQKYGFPKAPAPGGGGIFTKEDDDFNNPSLDSEYCEMQRSAFYKELDAWEEQEENAWITKRKAMIDNGTWTIELDEQEENQREATKKRKREEFEERLASLLQERQAHRDPRRNATVVAAEPKGNLTVFVIQSKQFYQNPPGGEIYHMIPNIVSNLGNSPSPLLFIFSEVQPIESGEVLNYFNNCIRYAFLLDDIVRFINDKGHRTVFGSLDGCEMKDQFGPCELGDGFFYDIDRSDIAKLKILSANPD